MVKRWIVTTLVAVMLVVQVSGSVRANPDGGGGGNEKRDTQSRNEQAALRILPLLLSDNARVQVAIMILMMHSYSYQLVMSQGVKVSSQNRVGLGGLFGGLFGKVYTAEDFLKSREVGSVYLAGNETAAVVLKGDRKLEDYRVILFNGENQYDITGRPELRQLDPQALAQLATMSLFTQLATHSLDAATVDAMAEVEATGDTSGPLAQQYLSDIPMLRQHLVGKVYMGADNTLLIVIPPAVVLDR